MVYRVILTLIIGFALLSGSASVAQVEAPVTSAFSSNSAPVQQTESQLRAGANSQPSHPADSTAAVHWWQRLAPAAGSSSKPATARSTNVAPAPQSATNATGSPSYIGKLFKGTDKKRPQIDPFAVRAASYEETDQKPTVVVAETDDPSKRDSTPPAAAANPWAAIATDSLASTQTGKCPYPDTGIQTLYDPVPGAIGTTVSDRPASSEEPATPGKVHSAFDGLLGHDDVRTQKEAASLPLLSPYKELPFGSPQATASTGSVKQGTSVSNDGKKAVAETEKAATPSAVAQNPGHPDATLTDSNKSVVNSAFTLPTADAQSKTVDAQGIGSTPGTPQPLQLNGVEAHQMTGSPLNRPKFIYRPATSVIDNAGHKLIKPEVRVAPDSVASSLPTSVQLAQFAAATEANLPAPNMAPESAYPIDDQQWMPEMSGFESGACDNCEGNCNGNGWHHGCRDGCNGGGGIGTEHVAQAPFFIQTTQPFNNCRVRLDLARDLEFPDRSEYFWAQTKSTGRGPGNTLNGETSVNYQDLDFYIEKGTSRLSIGTDLPIRAVDPEIRDDTTGFADMSVRTKAVIMDGKCWQLTQLFNTYLPTGSVHHGTGDGHVSLEPGVAYRWKWSDRTYFHGDLKYLFPIAADPNYSGQIFNYGFGWSHVAFDTDTWALIPTFEVECWTFVDGQQTIPDSLASNAAGFEKVNTIGIMNICPGLRWVCDKGCDCGTKEFGISAGISVTEDHLYSEILRLELRWSR